MSDAPVLAAVINWNGWRDTLVCLESMQALSDVSIDVVVCDNGSTNESPHELSAWLQRFAGTAPLRQAHTLPGASLLRAASSPGSSGGAIRSASVLLLPRNLGYAGAINECLALGASAGGYAYYWLLNNDLQLEPDALAPMVRCLASDAKIGMCGSVLLEWDAPHDVQAIGSVYQPLIAVGRHLKQLPPGFDHASECFFDIDYPVGASMLVTDHFLRTVGPMDPDYFLYYEEVDWATRARLKGFRPCVALRSRIRHKEGASTGSEGGLRSKSMLSEYYGVVNRLRYTRKFHPLLLPIVWSSLFLVALERLLHREWRRAFLVLRLMLAPGTRTGYAGGRG